MRTEAWPEKALCKHHKFYGTNGEQQQTSESEDRGGVDSISLMLTLASYKIIRQFV